MEIRTEPAPSRSMRRIGWKAAACAILAAGWIGWGWSMPDKAAAEQAPLELTVEAGYQGKIKEDRWFPVQFTIENPGDDLTGELAVEVASPFDGKDMTYHVQLDLPKGSTKTVAMALPGMAMTERNNRIYYYQGGVDGGKRIPFAGGDASVTVQPVAQGTYQIGVLARDPDTMNFMALLNQQGTAVSIVPLRTGELFSDPKLLDGLDALVVNDMAGTEWKPEMTAAVKSWVRSGRSLILAGGAGYAKTAAPFAELAPVEGNGTTSVSSLVELVKATGKELKLEEPMTVSAGTLKKEARALFKEDGIPLIAVGQTGFGKVWYAAYDLSLQPLASWQGSAVLWGQVLAGELRTGAVYRNGPPQGIFGPGFHEISPMLEFFPSLAPPSMGILLVVLLIYAAVAGPVIYLVLKRLDKREWSWAAIPGIALLVSGGIYLFGASDRSSTIIQALTLAELNGTGQVTETTAVGAFVPKGGTYSVSAEGYSQASPLGSSFNGGRMDMEGESDTYVRQAPGKAEIRYEGVPYWSVRKAWFTGGRPQESGSIGYSLTLEAGSPKGEFRNGLKTDLSQVYFYSGSQWYFLGDLQAGATAAVDGSKLAAGLAPNNLFNIGPAIFPYQGPVDTDGHKRALLQAAMEQLQAKTESAFVLGWSESKNSTKLSVDGQARTAEELKMWIQPVRMELVSGGSAQLPLGMVRPVVNTPTAVMKGTDMEGNLFVERGEVELLYRLPDVEGAVFGKVSALNVHAVSGQDYYEIWNEKQQQYEPLERLQSGTDLADYWTGDGRTLKVKLIMRQSGPTRFPEFGFEGRAEQ